jgi:hypothetical protein
LAVVKTRRRRRRRRRRRKKKRKGRWGRGGLHPGRRWRVVVCGGVVECRGT